MSYVRRLQPRHWTLIAGFISALGMQMGGIEHWAEATSPMFVSGVLAQLALLIGAMHVEPPNRPRSGGGSGTPGAVSNSTRSKYIGVGVLLLFASSCAARGAAPAPSRYDRLGTTAVAVHDTIAAVHDLERALYLARSDGV